MDELDDLLKPASLPPERNADAVWQCTRGVLRRRRWTRRAAAVAVMAGCFFSGAWVFRMSPAPNGPIEIAQQDEKKKPANNKKIVEPHEYTSPKQIEGFANMANGDRQVELFRKAGDAYLMRGQEV